MSTANSVSRVDPAAFHWPEGPGAGTSGDTVHTVSGTGAVTDGGPGEAVRRVTDAARAHDGAGPLDEATLLSLRHRGITSSALWLGHRDGAIEDAVGFALADTVPGSATHGSTVEVNLVVEPASRRTGMGGALASAVLDAFPDAALAAWSHGNHPGAAALAARFGFDRVRDLWVMRRRLGAGAEPLPELASSAAVEIRAFEPGRDEDAFLAVNAEAFVHHPEQGRMTRADLEQRMAEPWFDPAGFFLAEPADRPRDVQAEAEVESPSLLGFHWTKVHPGADGRPPVGEVYVVGVSPAAQGMGLGRLLTLTGLHHLERAGLGEVILYVEADNAPAVAVYQGLGFTHADEDTHVMYRRPAPG